MGRRRAEEERWRGEERNRRIREEVRRRGEEGSRGVGEHACTKDKVSCSPEKNFIWDLCRRQKILKIFSLRVT